MERIEVLNDDQRRIMGQALIEEAHKRDHVVVYLSGAHAYGFPSPDSDLDLKAIHIAKTDALLGLEPPAPTADRAEVLEGVEIDYTSNELGHALLGILHGNGNFIERVLGRLAVITSPLHKELQVLTRGSLSKRVHRHYRGFAMNQLQFLEKEPSAKKILYVLRTTLTGTHLLRTGELETDLTRVMQPYGMGDAAELIERKRSGERVGLDPALLDAWRPRLQALFDGLDDALSKSALPDEPRNLREVDAWLIETRRART
jgi:uncharacterized protein